MSLTIRNIAVNGVYYGVTVLLLPLIALSLEHSFGIVSEPSNVLQAAAAILVVIGAGVQLWCILLFQIIGRGTPSPAYPPRTLVVKGPYTLCRNPMNVGELILLFGLSAWFASPLLLLYSIAVGISFHAFILMYEEPANLKRFGEDHAHYCKQVNRWIPCKRTQHGIHHQLNRSRPPST
jgi:protein-S-isoprenylcysteine O-methyltransferase Ste14